jgi:hypothetical protein
MLLSAEFLLRTPAIGAALQPQVVVRGSFFSNHLADCEARAEAINHLKKEKRIHWRLQPSR